MTVGGFVCFLFVCFKAHLPFPSLDPCAVQCPQINDRRSTFSSDTEIVMTPSLISCFFVCLFVFLPTHEGVTLSKAFVFWVGLLISNMGVRGSEGTAGPPLCVSFPSSYPWAKYWTPSFPWFIHKCVNVRLNMFKVNGWIRFVVRKCFKCSNKVEKHRSTNPCTVKLTFVSFMMIINVKDWYYH